MAATRTIAGTQKLSLANDSLKDLQISIDDMIQQTIDKMVEKGVEEAKLAVSLQIKLAKVDEGNGIVYVPKFDHKVASTYQEKMELSGSFGGTDYEVVDVDGAWSIRNAQNGQMSLEL